MPVINKEEDEEVNLRLPSFLHCKVFSAKNYDNVFQMQRP